MTREKRPACFVPNKLQMEYLRGACESPTGEIAEFTYRASGRNFAALEKRRVSRKTAAVFSCSLDALVDAGFLLPAPCADTDDYLARYRITEPGREIVREKDARERVLTINMDGGPTGGTVEWSPAAPADPLWWEFTSYGDGTGHYLAARAGRSYRIDFPVITGEVAPKVRLWLICWRIRDKWAARFPPYYDPRQTEGRRVAPILAGAKEVCRVHALTGVWTDEPVDVERLVGGSPAGTSAGDGAGAG